MVTLDRLYTAEQVVQVFAPERQWRKVNINGTLTGEDVLPGFELAVRDIFLAQEQA